MTPSQQEGSVNDYSRLGRYGNIRTDAAEELVWFIDEPRDPFDAGQLVAFSILPDRTHNDLLAAQHVEPLSI